MRDKSFNGSIDSNSTFRIRRIKQNQQKIIIKGNNMIEALPPVTQRSGEPFGKNTRDYKNFGNVLYKG